VLEHVLSHNSSEIKKKSKKRPLGDHARRGLRDAIISMLESWSMNEDPDFEEYRMIIHRAIIASIVSNQVIESNPHTEVDSMVKMMMHRFSLVRNAPVIGRLQRLNPGLWQSVDRLQPLLLDGARQYGAPDLIIWNGDRLTMVRITMEMNSRQPKEAVLLELGSMILWAERNPLIAVPVDQMDVIRIGWLGTRWVKWQRRANSKWAAESRSMIAMDIEQMAHLIIFSGDIDELPRSRSKWNCRNCSFKQNCPGAVLKSSTLNLPEQKLGQQLL
jgi:hypothetical protein